MQPLSPPHRRRMLAGGHAGFTLIELLAVMAIILVLAGLILGVAAHANNKASRQRAQSEIFALSASIENYKVDNGIYPRSKATDDLVPQTSFDPGAAASGGNSGNAYQQASAYLYQELSGLHPGAAATKGYFTFQPSQLDIAAGAPTGTVRSATSPYMYVADPFGFAYGYSTVYQKGADIVASGAGTQPEDQGYNPTFDMWSTAGYSRTGGKGTPANGPNASQASIYSGLWIKNW